MKNFIFSLSRPLWAVYGVLNAIFTPIQGGGGGGGGLIARRAEMFGGG
ncbi:MAG: hypothetical protein ACR2QC_05510 [Gammaproteobacteria bacterium]